MIYELLVLVISLVKDEHIYKQSHGYVILKSFYTKCIWRQEVVTEDIRCTVFLWFRLRGYWRYNMYIFFQSCSEKYSFLRTIFAVFKLWNSWLEDFPIVFKMAARHLQMPHWEHRTFTEFDLKLSPFRSLVKVYPKFRLRLEININQKIYKEWFWRTP